MNKHMIHLYFGARQTCLEMLKDRFYNVPGQLSCITEQHFTKSLKNGDKKYMEISGIKDTLGRPVFVKMSTETDRGNLFVETLLFLKRELPPSSIRESKDSKDKAEEIVNDIKNIRLIIIYDPEQSSSFSKLSEIYVGDSMIEAFDVHLMFINPKKHVYQPKWRLMGDDEVSEMLRRYEAKSSHPSRVLFGSVCIDDPMNRYYGGHPPSQDKRNGDMYEITRDGVNIFYRKVISKRMNLKN